MSETATKEEEPSIEEILNSIKQIISEEDDAVDEDNVEDVLLENPPEDSDLPLAEDDDDVLVLTDAVVSEEEMVEEEEPEEEFIAVQDVEIDLQDVVEPEEEAVIEEPATEEVPVVAEDPAPVANEEMNAQGILTEKAQAVALEKFSNFVRQTNMERGGGLTLEDIVRSELNPLLREWLDEYLPDIIERLVREELHEITKRILD